MRPGRGGMASCCYKRSCCNEVSVRARGSKPPTHAEAPEGCGRRYQKAVKVMFLWSRGYSSVKFCEDELGSGINKSVTARRNRRLRQVVAEALAEAPMQLGGPSRTVEHDESLFSLGSSEAHAGKLATPLLYQWNRSSQILLPVIQRHVRPGSTVITYEWRRRECILNPLEHCGPRPSGEQAALWNASECTCIAPLRVHGEEAIGSL
ncbi:hypothetical protein M514_09495 [Trichuris suis]|uniref:ISXO2-like transposase domain-containing protein n=1 Tax=Trichuris suis TaxID=68888 RepID=A0A085NA23_9BILA|nr:hypothetical protein M513_09495 [Trichuris suis]KFD66319.1 hypothetical protein M514_09495 [Trichuris suis]